MTVKLIQNMHFNLLEVIISRQKILQPESNQYAREREEPNHYLKWLEYIPISRLPEIESYLIVVLVGPDKM